MKNFKSVLSVLTLTAGFGLGASEAWAKHGMISSTKLGESNYCHMHFPAIDERTLNWDNPVLKDAGTSDIIHYYGRCDYDPHGKEAVWAQRIDRQRYRGREFGE